VYTETGNSEGLAQLIRTDERILNKTTFHGDTLLHVAAHYGQTDVVSYLIEKGISPNVTNPAGLTPLHFAAAEGRIATARLLLALGADVNATGGRHRFSALQMAAQMDLAEMAMLLIEHGAEAGYRNSEGETALQIANKYGYTAVSRALRAEEAGER
jgi:hypothetical protein